MDGLCGEELFSAYAEVFLEYSSTQVIDPSFLCLRRGVSVAPSGSHPMNNFSLPTQRCFPTGTDRNRQEPLFSAYAEVFLTRAGVTS